MPPKRRESGGGGAKKPAAKRLKKGKKISKDELTSKEDLNPDVTSLLSELGRAEQAAGNRWQAVSYFRAAGTIKKYPRRLKSAEEALTLPGVGEAIALKVQEILDSGGLRKLEEKRADPRVAAVGRLEAVPGVGPAAAARLYDEHGIDTVEALAARPELVKGAAAVGVRYALEAARAVPLAEARRYAAAAARAVREADGAARLEEAGFARRGEASGARLDFVLTHEAYTLAVRGKPPKAPLAAAVKALEAAGLVSDRMTLGKLAFTGFGLAPEAEGAAEGAAAGSQAERRLAADADRLERERREAERAEEARLKQLHFAIPDSDSDSDAPLAPPPVPAAAAAPPKPKAEPKREAAADEKGAKGDDGGDDDDDGTRYHRLVAVHLVPVEGRAAALLLHTGPREVADATRSRAAAQGMHLSDYGLYRGDSDRDASRLVPAASERDIFERLGLDYAEPGKRDAKK